MSSNVSLTEQRPISATASDKQNPKKESQDATLKKTSKIEVPPLNLSPEKLKENKE